MEIASIKEISLKAFHVFIKALGICSSIGNVSQFSFFLWLASSSPLLIANKVLVHLSSASGKSVWEREKSLFYATDETWKVSLHKFHETKRGNWTRMEKPKCCGLEKERRVHQKTTSFRLIKSAMNCRALLKHDRKNNQHIKAGWKKVIFITKDEFNAAEFPFDPVFHSASHQTFLCQNKTSSHIDFLSLIFPGF